MLSMLRSGELFFIAPVFLGLAFNAWAMFSSF
jgi:hypothetical protein